MYLGKKPNRDMEFLERIPQAFPNAWHIERSDDSLHWNVMDNSGRGSGGHIVVSTAGQDFDVLNEKAAAAFIAHAPEMYSLLCILHDEDMLPKRSPNGYNTLGRFLNMQYFMRLKFIADM